MESKNMINAHNKSAAEYDRLAKEQSWLGPEVIFGLCYEFVKPGDTLLDIGIGTGLSSLPFHKAGLQIHGIDGSREMLNICASKNMAVELRLFDLLRTPLPYSDGSFDHVIAIGVFHIFRDLEPLFKETARLIKAGGIFAVTVDEQKPCRGERCSQDGYVSSQDNGISEKTIEHYGVKVYRHSTGYIQELLKTNGFVPLKNLEFLASKSPQEEDIFFKAYVTQRRAEFN